jgi:DnaJ-class molecular chaperone
MMIKRSKVGLRFFSNFAKSEYLKQVKMLDNELEKEGMVPFMHYKALGLRKEASLEEIKTSFRKINLNFHPDKSGDLSKEQYLRVTNAYKVLGKLESKEEYDEEELEKVNLINFGGHNLDLHKFLAFGVMANVVFWLWYFWDDLLGKGGDCPLDNPDLAKMRKEGLNYKEARRQL